MYRRSKKTEGKTMNRNLLAAAFIIVAFNFAINVFYILSNTAKYFGTTYGTGLFVGEILYYGAVAIVLYGLYQRIGSEEE